MFALSPRDHRSQRASESAFAVVPIPVLKLDPWKPDLKFYIYHSIIDIVISNIG